MILGITPFQYNPVSKDLLVYTDVRVRVNFEGGNGHFGEDRYRSRYWDPLLEANLLNYNALSQVDFNRRRAAKDTGYEYVIIVPDDPDFIAWADTIRHWRTLQGISTEVFTLTETGSSASQIESWINNAYNNWDIPPVAVLLLSDSEVQFDLDIGLPLMDEFVITPGPGLSPQCPGHGIDQRRLAVAVVPADAGGVNTIEIQGGYVVPVAHEITHL